MNVTLPSKRGRTSSGTEHREKSISNILGIGLAPGRLHHRSHQPSNRGIFAISNILGGLRLGDHCFREPLLNRSLVTDREEIVRLRECRHGLRRLRRELEQPINRLGRNLTRPSQAEQFPHLFCGDPDLVGHDARLVRPLGHLVQQQLRALVAGRFQARRIRRGELGINRPFKETAETLIVDQGESILVRQTKIIAVPRSPRDRKFGNRRPNLILPGFVHLHGHQIGLREISVIVGIFLLSLQHGHQTFVIPASRLLHSHAHDSARRKKLVELPFGLMANRTIHGSKTVEVLNFDYWRSKLPTVGGIDHEVDVGLETHVALLHDPLGHPEKSADGTKFPSEGHHVFGTIEIGFGHDFEQRRTGSVEIHQTSGVSNATGKLVTEFPRVLLKMGSGDSDPAYPPVGVGTHRRNIDRTVETQREVVLTDLVALGQIRIGVVFSIPLGMRRDGAPQGHAHHRRHLDGAAVHDRQTAGQGGHQGIDQGVGFGVLKLRTSRIPRSSEHFRASGQLNVDLQTDDESGGGDIVSGEAGGHAAIILRIPPTSTVVGSRIAAPRSQPMSHQSLQTRRQCLAAIGGIAIVGSLLAIPADGSNAVPGIPRPVTQASGISQDLLQPNRLYNRIGRSIPVVLSLRGRTEAPEAGFDLLLIDADGTVLDSANGGQPGEFDLLTTLPAIMDLQRSARIQVIADGMATGTPLVVQPMIGRTPVRTTRDFRPGTDTRYTRVLGFGDTVLDPDAPDDVAKLEKMKRSPDWDPGEPPVLTGFRIYPDRDVRIETDAGEILVALAPESAPNTAWNFRHLAAHGFYDDTTFHRVVHFDRTGRRFVIQGGDPSGTGEGSAGWDLPMENSTLSHDLGVISMARADHPDSAGSQFFFCLSREGTARLDGQYCAFGYAVKGAETIAKTADVEIEDVAAGKPTTPPSITRMSLVPAPPQDPGTARSDRRITEWWTPEVKDTSDERRPR